MRKEAQEDCALGVRRQAGHGLFSALGCKYQQRLKVSGGELCSRGQQVESVLAYAYCWLALMDYMAVKGALCIFL